MKFITRCSNTCPMRLCKHFLGPLMPSGTLVISPTAGVRPLSFLFQKPGKDKSDSSNYRPIALTSCICKIMERMINDRLVWYLERNNFITPVQSGFRKQRSTTDHLVRLESFVWGSFCATTTCCCYIL